MTELLPVLLFFVCYKFFDIYFATMIAIIAAVLMAGFTYFRKGRLEVKQLIPVAVLVVFGSATLFLKDPIFIKWKPSVVTWITGTIFLISHFVGRKPIVGHLFGDKLELTPKMEKRLNLAWSIYFLIIGTVNLIVAYNVDTDTWVNFKLFGVGGMTLIFALVQSIFIVRHQKPELDA